MSVVALTAAEYEAAIPGLAALLVDAVDGGAGVNFLAGVTSRRPPPGGATAWTQVRDGTITAFVARDPDDRRASSARRS